MKQLLLSHNDFSRIFRTIYSILSSENAKIDHSCIWFSLIGAAILHQHYNLVPRVYMGIAAYMVDEVTQTVLTFAEKEEDRLISTEQGFHSWIEVDGFVIDFTSPLFPSMLEGAPNNPACEPKMFQKEVSAIADSPRQIRSSGDFYLSANVTLTNDLVDHFLAIPCNLDLLNICCNWYRRPPDEMLPHLPVSDDLGTVKNIPLQSFHISGAW